MRSARRAPARTLVLALAVSLGCGSLFDASLRTLEFGGWLAQLNPFAWRHVIDSMPFDIHLPTTLFGEDPDFSIDTLLPGEAIILIHDSRRRSSGSTETLRVQIWERSVDQARDRCVSGQGTPFECRIVVTTPRGRTVFASFHGSYPTNLRFVIDRALIEVSMGRHESSSPGRWAPIELSPQEAEALVDSFEKVGAWELYWMPLRDGQDVE